MKIQNNKRKSNIMIIAGILLAAITTIHSLCKADSFYSQKIDDPSQVWYFTIKNMVDQKDDLTLTLVNGSVFSNLEQIVNNFTSDQVMASCSRKTSCQFNLWTFTDPIATIIDSPGNYANSIQIVPRDKYSNYNITVNGRVITISASDAVKN